MSEKKTTDELAEEIKKGADKWMKFVDETSNQIVKFVNDGTKDLQETFKSERKKIEIKSQIGEHQRALTKAYTRLGEAYYESVEKKTTLDTKDVFELIKLNKKVIGMLQKQLDELDNVAEAVDSEDYE